MKRFAALYRTLDRATGTLDKRAALVAYFRDAPALDAAWALYLLAGGKVASARMRIASSGELREWITDTAGIADWLVADSYDHVGDLAETLALLLDDPVTEAADLPLAQWIEQRLLPIANQDVDVRKACIVQAWRSLAFDERLAFNKLLTGALRVGVSQRLVQQALAELSGVDIARIAQRMLGSWRPHPTYLAELLTSEELPGDRQQPYPFFLASPLE
ncbi:ATP-dependent DNA ligase, partial [Xanthomonas citri pv. citri]